jgi:hypothetical protein
MKRYIIALTLLSCYWEVMRAQNVGSKPLVVFSYQYPDKNDSDKVKLIVKNISPDRTLYYTIGVQGFTDTGWVVLNPDINSLGQNDFVALKPIKPHAIAIKNLSKKHIGFLYAYYGIRKLRFSLGYYGKQDFDSKSHIIYLEPM